MSSISNVSAVPAETVRAEVVAPVVPAQSNVSQARTAVSSQERLVIEPVSSNRYVYKVMDSVTGEVVRQLPTEHVEKMITDPGYQQGGVVRTEA